MILPWRGKGIRLHYKTDNGNKVRLREGADPMGTAMRQIAAVGIVLIAMVAEAAPPGVSQLWSQATLYRDEWGTPHVYADNALALAFAFGYAQAEDHLESMLMAYRIANGRAAEVQGEAYAQSDEFSIFLNHAGLAEAAYRAADSTTRDLCDGFALGANTWIVEHPNQTPPWVDGVRPPDVLALLHCYLMSLAPFDLPKAYHFPPAATTGNAFAVAPAQSQTGETLLAINPHTSYNGPFQWYEAHLVCQDLNVAGATLYGLPVILQGHNGLLGWALTPNQADTADVYTETMPQVKHNPKVPQVPGQLEREQALLYTAMMSNARTYYVSMPYGVEERRAQRLDSPRGPVVGQYNGRMCSWKAGGYQDFGALAQLVEMGRAQDLDEFQSALRMQQLPCFHILYADRKGNLFYLYNAKVGNKLTTGSAAPSEATGNTPMVADWTLPVPADDTRFNWGDIVPIDLLPAVLNPASGYLQACGNPPWGATAGSKLNAADWPNWFARDPDSLRARRVRRLLGMGPRSFSDMENMLYDTLAPGAVETAPLLLKAAQQAPEFVSNAHPDLAVGLDLLRNWNYVAETNSSAMTFFRVWWAALHSEAGPAMQADSVLADALKKDTPETRRLALNAANEAAKLLRNQFQTPTAPWGDVHTLRRGDREEPMLGCAAGEPIFTVSDGVFGGNKWPVTYGPGFAMVVKFGERPEAVSMTPFGASEVPGSPHFDDQFNLMLQRRYKRTRFLQDDVMKSAERAKGRTIRLRAPGVEGMFTIASPEPIEARLNMSTTPPANLPDGLATFTVYVQSEVAPAKAPVTVGMEIYIADVLCDAQQLGQLAVYSYDSEHGWVRLDSQQLAADTRTFRAQDAFARTIAVLGPEELRPAPAVAETPVIPGAPEPPKDVPPADSSPVKEPAWLQRETAPVIPRVELPLTSPLLAENALGGPMEPGKGSPLEPSAQETDRRPMAPFEARANEGKSNRVARNYNRGLRPKTKEPEEDSATEPAPPRKKKRGHSKKNEAPETPEAVEQPAPEAPRNAPNATGTEPEQVAMANNNPAQAPVENPEPAPADKPAPAPSQPPPGPAMAPAVEGPRYPSVGGWGREVQLQPPGMEGLVVVKFPLIAKAALFVSDEPPAAVPAGLAAFTKFIGFHIAPPRVEAELAISLKLPANVCSAENLSKLSLYAYDDKKGWYPLPGQKLAPESRGFTAIDSAPHPYAILGPADCAVK